MKNLGKTRFVQEIEFTEYYQIFGPQPFQGKISCQM